MVHPRPSTHWVSNVIFSTIIVAAFLSRLASAQDIYGDDEGEEEADPNEEFKNSPVTPAVAVAGSPAVLPCNISTINSDDSVQLVLWYRDHVPTPIYSYDVRLGVYSRPKEWADPQILGERAHFSMTTIPAALVLNQTRRPDQAVYRCRVDYKRLTTTHARVNLTVIEPVGSVSIMDENGMELVGAAGPYTVGQRPSLTCRVQGGDPPPAVTWWRDGRLVDGTYHHQSLPSRATVISNSSSRDGVEPGPIVVNTINLRALKKEDLRSTYTCQATNHDLAPTKETAVELDMNFGPESVEVRGLEGSVSAGRPHQVVCEARGSRPPAILTWWLDGSMKQSVSHMTSLDGLVSTSTLELVIGPEDEGSKLTCRAENPELPATTIEASHQLQVLYPPEVHVAPGSSLDLNHIKEGDDVYFDCHIKARPEAHKITWTFNGMELQQNVSGGVMVVGRSLVLQKVSRKQAGSYACSATNNQGSNTSSSILLSVKYSPVCGMEQTDVYGVGRHEKTTVTCRVEADPPVTTYRWAFNNTGEFVDIPHSHYDIKGDGIKSQRSDLRYSPVSDLDYGTLLCWATNAVGMQRTPCTFTVFPAGKPDVVTSCNVFNETEESVSVSCEPGYSGGVDQTFVIEAWDDGVIRATDKSDTPILQLAGLRPGTRYTLKVFASNAMGRSLPFVFTAFTLTDVAERRTALGAGKPGEPLSPIVGSVIGGVLAVALLLVIALVVAKCKRRNAREAHSLRESSSAGDAAGYKSCGKAETRQDSGLTDTTDTHGHSGPDLVSASQESAMMTHSHDSSTPLIGNGRVTQGKQEQLYPPQQQQPYPLQQQYSPQQQQQQYVPQQHYPEQQKPSHIVMVEASPAGQEVPYYQEDLPVEGGNSGGSSGSMPYTPQKVTYVPVYDYQHLPQHKAEREWAVSEGVWTGTPVTAVTKDQPDSSPLSPYGVVDTRRHSAYLRPLDQLPGQLSQLPPHLTDHQLARQYQPTPHHPPPTTPKLFQPTSEHESAV